METPITLISPTDIQRDALQPRTRFEGIEQLADSIREHGQLQAIVVRATPKGKKGAKKYQIIYGERRWLAATLIMTGYRSPIEDQDIPANPDIMMRAEISTRPVDGSKDLELQLIENLERRDMTMMEEARAFARLTTDLGYSQRGLSSRIKVPKSLIQDRLRLLRLSVENQERLDLGEVPLWAATLAVAVPDTAISLDPDIHSPVDAALDLAVRVGDRISAKHAVHLKYILPTEERAKWKKLWELGREWVPLVVDKTKALELYWEASPSADLDWQVLSYEDSRAFFDFGVTRLLPPTRAGGYRHGEDKPASVWDGLAPGAEVRETWEQLAARYGVPLTVACDGMCAPVILVRSEMVVDAARTAHDDDPEACPFAIHDGKGHRAQEQAGRAKKAEGEAEERIHTQDVVSALRAMESRIWSLHRTNAPRSPAMDMAYLEAQFFLVQQGALGFGGPDNAFVQLLDVLGAPDDEEGAPSFSNWPGLWEQVDGEWRHGRDFKCGMETLAVLSLVLDGMRVWQGAIEECPEWVEMRGVYGV
jgi:ParB-like chromosome segregation protein Spo0J